MIPIIEERCLLGPDQIIPSRKEMRVLGTLNPAAVRMKNKEIMLYVRVIEKLIPNEDKTYRFSPRMVGKKNFNMIFQAFSKKKILHASDLDFSFKDQTKRLTFISHFRRVVLDSRGFNVKYVDQEPTFFGNATDGELGVEDARIVKIGDKYVMTYVALAGDSNVSTSYATSKDLRRWKREGIIFREQNKDVVIFPEKINGKYYAINRPEGTFSFSSPHMYISESPNLDHWGEPTSINLSTKESWDSGRVGAGPPPLKTEYGWLLIYHGVVEKSKRPIYAAGAALLDLKNPRKLIAKLKKPLLLPRKDYDKGDFEDKDVVFPTGMVMHENKQDILIYSGGGDINTTVRQMNLKTIIGAMEDVS